MVKSNIPIVGPRVRFSAGAEFYLLSPFLYHSWPDTTYILLRYTVGWRWFHFSLDRNSMVLFYLSTKLCIIKAKYTFYRALCMWSSQSFSINESLNGLKVDRSRSSTFFCFCTWHSGVPVGLFHFIHGTICTIIHTEQAHSFVGWTNDQNARHMIQTYHIHVQLRKCLYFYLPLMIMI